MAFRYLNRPRGGSTRAFDTDVLAWEAAVVANGGSVSLARRIILDQFVFSEKASGAWALTDDYWGLWGENAEQALTSLKQCRLAVATNSPTFTADQNYTFDGVSNYINTGFVPTVNGVALTGLRTRIAVYDRTNVSSAGISAGAVTSGVVVVRISTRNGANTIARVTSGDATLALPASNSQGFTAVSRDNSTTINGYKTGVALTPVTIAVGSTLPAFALYIGCANNSGTAGNFRAAATGLVAIGGPLSAAQELAQYAAVQAWATSIGANV